MDIISITYVKCVSVVFLILAATSEPVANMDTSDDDDVRQPTTKRGLRSSLGLCRVQMQARSRHVLPSICVLRKKEKTITCRRMTRKRKQEPLTKCSLIEAPKLLKAAKDNNSTALLL